MLSQEPTFFYEIYSNKPLQEYTLKHAMDDKTN